MYQAWFDGSVDRANKISIIGYIVVNEESQIIKEYANKTPHFIDNSVKVEIQAFNELLRTLIRRGIDSVEIKTDCKTIVSNVLRQPTRRSLQYKHQHKKIFRQSVILLNQIKDVRLIWVPRSKNKYADKLCDIGKLGAHKKNSGQISI